MAAQLGRVLSWEGHAAKQREEHEAKQRETITRDTSLRSRDTVKPEAEKRKTKPRTLSSTPSIPLKHDKPLSSTPSIPLKHDKQLRRSAPPTKLQPLSSTPTIPLPATVAATLPMSKHDRRRRRSAPALVPLHSAPTLATRQEGTRIPGGYTNPGATKSVATKPQPPTQPKKRSTPSRHRARSHSNPCVTCDPSNQVKATQQGENKIQIPRKLFNVIRAIFQEHDTDGDGVITREEFTTALRRFQTQENPRWIKQLENHAEAMHEAVTRKSIKCQQRGGITLVQFVALYFPHLPMSVVERACHHYTYTPPPPPPKEKTLDDIDGARAEITAIFDNYDTDHDGFVRVKSLQALFHNIGVSEQEASEWLSNLPSNQHSLCRLKSKLDVTDMEHLLAPTYIAQALTPRALSYEQLQQRLDWNNELYLDLIGAQA